MNRRTVISAVALLPLAACAGQTPAQVTTQVVADANLIATGLSKELPVIGTLTGVSAATLAKLSADVSGAIAVGQSVATDLTTSQAGTLVQKIAGYVTDALNLATSAPLNALLPPSVLPVLEAANALLPVLEAAVGLAGAITAPITMTPSVARETLAAA